MNSNKSIDAQSVIPTAEPQRVSWVFIGVYALAYTGIWLALLTPIIVTIALRVRQLTPEHAAQNLALVLSVGATCAIFAGPLFGYLSDRTTSRFGMRRPWMIGGMAAGCVALAWMATATSISHIAIAWCLAQIALNAALASTVALLADQIPPAQRGTVAGILGICMPLGQLIGTYVVQLVDGTILLAFMIPAAVGTAAVVLLTAILPDRRIHVTTQPGIPGQTTPRKSLRITLQAFRLSGRQYRNFWCAWLSRFLLGVGSAFLTTYQPLYLVENLGRATNEVPTLVFRSMLLQSVLIVIVSLYSGRLSDRLGRRKIFVLYGALIYAAGLWSIALADSYAVFLVGLAITAIAHGMYFAVDLALVTEVLPDSERSAAKDLGILNVANALPQVVAPLMGASILFLAHGSYPAMYAMAGLIALLGAAAVLPMKTAR